MDKWIVVISSLLVLAFICWKETQRKNKVHLNLRLIASVTAVLALYFIAQPVSFQRQLDPAKENTAVLLTEGFEKDSLAGLKNIPVYTADRSVVKKNKNVKFIPDLEYFSRSEADINKIHIVGNGLDQHEIEAFRNQQLIFHPSPVYGFSSVHWNSTVRSGEKLTVQGSFKSESNKVVKILLRGLSTTLDSVELRGNQTFELNTTPKLLDKAIYSLIAIAERDTLANEKIPVIIEAKTPLKIIMLSSSPDFESKFLKNWLYSEQYSLAIRTNISKDKFSTEFLNTERVNLNRVSPALLENFDILIGDIAELSRLGAVESAAIQNQVNKGMGLVIRADSIGGTGFYRRAFNIRQNRAINQKSLTLDWDGQTAKKISPPTGWAMEIVPGSGEQALVRDNKKHVLVSSQLYGAGRMIVSTVADTYTWMLSNNSAEYASYWSHILEKAARKTELAESWTILNTFPVANSPSLVRLESTTKTIPSASAGNTPLHFEQDAHQLFRWTADYWPSGAGWQTIGSGNNESFWYVFDEKDWGSPRAAQKIKSTAKFISRRNTIFQHAESTVRSYTYTVPAMYFFILFLVACGYLWIEAKLK